MLVGSAAPCVTGFDTETHLIAAGDIIPRLVCATFDVGAWGSLDAGEAWCVPNADAELIDQIAVMLKMVLERRCHLIIQNAAYDLPVIMRYAQDVMAGLQVGNKSVAEAVYMMVWECLEQSLQDELEGRGVWVHDTIIREKLYNLGTFGSVDKYRGRDIRYDIAALVQKYFGVDISGGKVSMDQNGRIYDANGADITGTPQAGAAWRLRYNLLDGVPLHQWPAEAVQYAIDDATWARKVFVAQESNRKDRFYGSMNSESLQVYADTALKLYTIHGYCVDREQVARVHGHVEAVIRKVETILQVNGIVRPNNTVNTEVLRNRVALAWEKLGRNPMLTDGGENSAPAISAGSEALEELAGVDPVLDLYAERQELAKIRSSFLPALSGDRVYTNYDILKETGRISARGSSERSKRKPLYEAINITQIPRSHGVRECFLPSVDINWHITSPWLTQAPRSVKCSIDYSALELCSVAQVTWTLFRYSVHREKNLAGYDLHSYLGAAMAKTLAPYIVDEHGDTDKAMLALRGHLKAKIPDADTSPEAEHKRKLKKDAAQWRTFAKPVGLGYPGGLGPATLVTFAKATYGIAISQDQATAFRELWRHTYPEMPDFFLWVNQQKDTLNTGDIDCYVYETEGYNRFRAGASFCATANGKSMQSLSSDGAKRSVCWLARSCWGGLSRSSPFSLLHGCLPNAFIHDENLIDLPDDDLLTIRCLLATELMVRAMKVTMPDVLITAEPALMRRWTKKAEPEWVDDADLPRRVEAAIIAWYGGQPPVEWIDELFEILGPKFDPTKRLIPWDDAHKLDLEKA